MQEISLFFLYIRITDEFKDRETDKKYFPERPVPSGKVKLKALVVLKYFVILLLLVINAIFYKTFIGFLIVFILVFLMENYFIPRILGNNRILSLITHCPSYGVLYYFLLVIYARNAEMQIFSRDYLLIIVWIWIPLIIWEFARKTWSPEEEMEGYQTYSNMLGYKRATAVVMLLIILHNVLLYFCMNRWKFSWIITSLISGLALIFLIISLIFLKKASKRTNKLKLLGEAYMLIVYILIIINGLIFI